MTLRIALLLSFTVTLALDVSASPDVAVRFENRTITVSGLSPGTEVVIFGVLKIPMTYHSRLQRSTTVVTAGNDGVATAKADIDIPITSVWAIADLRTGKVTTATPSPRGVRTVGIGRSTIHGNADQFSFDRSFLDLLYVHAGEGAWIWHAADGGKGDEDGANGLTTVSVKNAIHISGAAPPKVFSPGGTLIAIDFIDLVVLTSDPQALSPGGQR